MQALKPVISGFTEAEFAGSDTAILIDALGLKPTPDTIEAISPWRFAAPISPDMAAAREARPIDFDNLVRFSADAISGFAGVSLIEGVGGVMVPLTAEATVIDWIGGLNIPVLLVVGSYLGTISHTLSAHTSLAARDIDVRAVVVSESEESPVPLSETTETLQRFLPSVAVWPIARGDSNAGPFGDLAGSLFPD